MYKVRILFFLLILKVFLIASCCPQRQAARERQKQIDRQEERYREGDRALEEARQKHMEMQSRETRDMMNNTRRKSDQWNKPFRRPFYVRWYRSVVSWFKGF